MEVRSVEPPPPDAAFVLIPAEFVLMRAEFVLIPAEFVLILAEFTAIKAEYVSMPAEFMLILAELVLIPAELAAMLVMLVDRPAEFVPILIIFDEILLEFALIAMTTDVRSVEPPPPAPFVIAAEFVLIPAEFVLILALFVPMLVEFIRMPIILPVIAFALEPTLIMFDVILSEFALIAITTEVRSVEPPPPAPFAIAAEFVLILAAFDYIAA